MTERRTTIEEKLGPVEAGLSIPEHLLVQEGALRAEIARKIMITFVIVNLAVLTLIFLIMVIDACFIYDSKIAPKDRLVTSHVITAVIGATTIQLGAIAIAVSNWLFPKRNLRTSLQVRDAE